MLLCNRMRSQADPVKVGCNRMSAAGHLTAIHLRHLHIHDHNIERDRISFFEAFQSLRTILCESFGVHTFVPVFVRSSGSCAANCSRMSRLSARRDPMSAGDRCLPGATGCAILMPFTGMYRRREPMCRYKPAWFKQIRLSPHHGLYQVVTLLKIRNYPSSTPLPLVL